MLLRVAVLCLPSRLHAVLSRGLLLLGRCWRCVRLRNIRRHHGLKLLGLRLGRFTCLCAGLLFWRATLPSRRRLSLFPASLISPAVAAALPEGYTIRPLQRGDYAAGFLDVLRVLTTVGEISQADFEARFDDMKQTSRGPVGSHVLVILDGEGKVVGTGALLVERKLYVSLPP